MAVDLRQFTSEMPRNAVRANMGAPESSFTENRAISCDRYELHTRGVGILAKRGSKPRRSRLT
jgi:hypothetical protein